jgi:hypothetical protein
MSKAGKTQTEDRARLKFEHVNNRVRVRLLPLLDVNAHTGLRGK